jgi:transcriptional regulator with XRE-family HTH domain
MSVMGLVQALRERMRAKGMTYGQLAKRIGVSESTIKRMLGRSARDMTLGRLDDICNVLGVTMAELMEGPEPTEFDAQHLSLEQEEALAGDRTMLQLLYGAMSIRDTTALTRYMRKTPKAVGSALRNLERLGLIDHDGKRVRPRILEPKEWIRGGPLARKLFPEMRDAFIAHSFEGELTTQSLRCFLISPESATVIRKKIRVLMAELADLSKIDLRFARDRIIPWSVHFAARPHAPSFFDDARFPSQQKLAELFPEHG